MRPACLATSQSATSSPSKTTTSCLKWRICTRSTSNSLCHVALLPDENKCALGASAVARQHLFHMRTKEFEKGGRPRRIKRGPMGERRICHVQNEAVRFFFFSLPVEPALAGNSLRLPPGVRGNTGSVTAPWRAAATWCC